MRPETRPWTMTPGAFILGLLLASLSLSAATVSAALPDNACATLRPAVEQVAAFQPILVEGEDSGADDLLVRVHSPGATALILTVDTAEQPARFSIPMHPAGTGQAGQLSLSFGRLTQDGASWCAQSHSVEIQALPAAGMSLGLQAELGLLRELLDDLLSDHDLDLGALAAADPATLAGELLLLWGPARLLAGANGIGPLWNELDGPAQDLGNALVSGWQSERPSDPMGLIDLPPAPPTATMDPPAPSAPPGWPGAAAPEPPPYAEITPPPPQPDPAQDCQRIGIDELGQRMGRQVSGQAMQSGSAGLALTAGKQIAGLPVISRVGLPTVLLAWTTDFVSQYQQGTQPSRFETLWLDYAPATLHEDDEAGGRVSELGLRFSSEGFDMGPMLAELALIAGGELAGRGLSAGLKQIGMARTAAGGTQFAASSDIVTMMHRGLDQARHLPAYARHADLIGELAAWAGALVAGGVIDQAGWAEGHRVVPGQCWDAGEGVDNSNDSRQRLHFTRAIERGDDPAHYRAASTGTGRIDVRWEVPIGQGVVGIGLSDQVRTASHTFGASANVGVPPLEVRISPQRTSVEAGQVVAMSVETGPADDARVRLRDSHGRLDREIDATSRLAFDYPVPADLAPGQSITISAESLSATGLRRPGQAGFRGPISGRAVLRIEQPRLYLAPARFCLEPGERQRYQAVSDPLSGRPVAVRWQASAGAIDADGNFLAPASTGQVTLQATAMEDPDLSASWTVTIDDCRAHWQAELSGPTVNVSFISGNQGQFRVSRNPHAGYFNGMTFPGTEQPDGPYLVIELSPAVSEGAMPGGDATPEELMAFLRAAQGGRSDELTGVRLSIPGATPGRTGAFRESFLILTIPSGSHESLADSAAGEVIPGYVSNGLLRTAEVVLEENSPTRVRGSFTARTLPQRFPRGSNRYPASQRGPGIFHYPDQEISVSGRFDIRLDD